VKKLFEDKDLQHLLTYQAMELVISKMMETGEAGIKHIKLNKELANELYFLNEEEKAPKLGQKTL
jgi:hypothetical protein